MKVKQFYQYFVLNFVLAVSVKKKQIFDGTFPNDTLVQYLLQDLNGHLGGIVYQLVYDPTSEKYQRELYNGPRFSDHWIS